jgi:SAM-dependent methyltransferase
MVVEGRVPSSFRDPSGHLFVHDGQIHRQINGAYQADYEALMASGLYDALVERGLLVAHEESDAPPTSPELAFKVIRPERVPFISYPYEWSFSELKDAAIATIAIQKLALEHGMSLKDSSAYNIQYLRGKPVLIDTLSFERYKEGQPWVAYRQFCQHFLGPLALMAYTDIRLSQLFRIYIDGVPLDLASRLLPGRTRFKPSLLTHIHIHASTQRRFAGKTEVRKDRKMPKLSLLGLISSLESASKSLKWRLPKTEWGDYYDDTNYTSAAMEHKAELVSSFFDATNPATVWDLGANTGEFSRIAAKRGANTVAFDIDPVAVERNYLAVRDRGDTNLLPLIIDLTNPSPGIGWHNEERTPIDDRGPVDTIVALALIHHLAIANNVPLPHVAEFFASLSNHLIIEFVPKSDSQVKRLLATREDIFSDYTKDGFEAAFAGFFRIDAAEPIRESERTLYRMSRIAR